MFRLRAAGYSSPCLKPGAFKPGVVNELLLLHSIVNDSAALRRALYEYRFMNRARDGSQYWLTGSELAENTLY